MIGGTLITLFGEDTALYVLHHIFPHTKHLSEEDQWGFELVKGPGVEFLQWGVSKLEAHRDSANPTHGRRILKALGGV